jgi:hypothetical protein
MVVKQSYAPEFELVVTADKFFVLACLMCDSQYTFESGTLFDKVCDEAWTHTEMHRTEYMRKS